MDAPTVALIAAVLSAAVISIGWIVTHFSTRWREIEARKVASAQAARTRHIELLLNHYQRQIEEFYVPLYSHIRLIWNIRKIQNRFVTGLPDKRGIIDRTLDSKYFSPLHEGIIEIFKTKLFLIEGADIPNSFTDYLAHSVTQRMQLRLEDEDGINTWSVKGFAWPPKFPEDIAAGLEKAMRSYDEILKELARSAAVAGLAVPVTSAPVIASPDRASVLAYLLRERSGPSSEETGVNMN